VQIAKLRLYKQYKSTNLDDMSYAKLQLKVMEVQNFIRILIDQRKIIRTIF